MSTDSARVASQSRLCVHQGSYKAIAISVAVIALSAVLLAMDMRWIYLLVYVWFGVIYGMLLQYGRFCMASAIRDLFAIKVPRMAVGVMIATALFSIAAGLVTISGYSTFHPHPLGWHIIVGGLIFGFGMIFTGGCASGSLYKSGEGNIASMLVLLSISFSQAWFVDMGSWSNSFAPSSWVSSAAEKGMPESLTVNDGWFDTFTAGYIWDLSGGTVAQSLDSGINWLDVFVGNVLLGAMLPTILILVLLYFATYRKGYVRRNKFTSLSFSDEVRGFWAMMTASKNTALAGLGLGVFAGLQMWATGALREHYNIFNFGELLQKMGYTEGLSIQETVFDPGYWYITTQEAQLGGWVLDKAGVDVMDNIFFGLMNGIPNPLINAPLLMSVGIIAGAAILALTRHEFKWKVPNLETTIFVLVGGALMGIGARLGMGCNVGAFFAAVTNGDMTGWIFLLGMLGGGLAGVKAFTMWINWRTAADDDFDI